VSQFGIKLVEVHHRHLRVGVVGSLSEKCPRGQLGKSPTEHASARWCPATFPCWIEQAWKKATQPRGTTTPEKPWCTHQPTHTQPQHSTNHELQQTQRAGRTNLVPGNTFVGWGQHPAHVTSEMVGTNHRARQARSPEHLVGSRSELQGERLPWKGPLGRGGPVGPQESSKTQSGPYCSPCRGTWKG
jgi:hypothetical protein